MDEMWYGEQWTESQDRWYDEEDMWVDPAEANDWAYLADGDILVNADHDSYPHDSQAGWWE